MFDKDFLREFGYNSNWDGTCGTCGNCIRWCPKYGNMENMRRTYCGNLLYFKSNSPYAKNLVMKNSRPKWCPRIKEIQDYEKCHPKVKDE